MERERDELTGLPDERALDRHLVFSIEAERRAALALLDVDGFARLNGELGPAVGDRTLRELARVLEEDVPGAAYRMGGDEFAVLLPDTGLEEAFLRMETLRARVAAERTRFGLPEEWRVAVSIGVAQYDRDGKTAGEVSNAAAAALRSAKENGGNRVALPPNEPMVMKSSYYPAPLLADLKELAEKLKMPESVLLREALNDLLRKYAGRGSWQSLSPMARQAIFLSMQEAADRGASQVDTEHLLLALLRDEMHGPKGRCVGLQVLARLGVLRDAVRAELERGMVPGRPLDPKSVRLTPRLRRTLDTAQDEARRANCSQVGTEHLLMAIARGVGPAARVLAEMGADLEALRREYAAWAAAVNEEPPSNRASEQAIHAAQRAAADRSAGSLDPEHLLLVLCAEGEGQAAQVLERLEVSIEELRAAVDSRMPRAEAVTPRGAETSPRWRRMHDLALQEARQMRRTAGTAHFLLGILREGGLAARLLAESGIELEAARREVEALPPEPEPPATAGPEPAVVAAAS